MKITAVKQRNPRTILAFTAFLSALPIALVVAFPAQLNRVMDPASYVVFHNIAEFFSIMVSLSIFGVGWFIRTGSTRRAGTIWPAFTTARKR